MVDLRTLENRTPLQKWKLCKSFLNLLGKTREKVCNFKFIYFWRICAIWSYCVAAEFDLKRARFFGSASPPLAAQSYTDSVHYTLVEKLFSCPYIKMLKKSVI